MIKQSCDDRNQTERRYAGQRRYIAPVFANYSEETLFFEDNIVNAVISTGIYVHRKKKLHQKGEFQDRWIKKNKTKFRNKQRKCAFSAEQLTQCGPIRTPREESFF